MGADIIQSQYDQLSSVAQRFDKSAQAGVDLFNHVQRSEQALRGHWVGMGAAAFFGEMDNQVLPALGRLAQAFGQAQTTTQAIIRILRQAEVEASRPFQGQASQHISTTPPRIYIVNGINSRGDRVIVDANGNVMRGDHNSVTLEQLLEDHGYDPRSVSSTPAIYIRPTGTDWTGTNWAGTHLGGLLSPIDWLTNSTANAANMVTGLSADAVNVTTHSGTFSSLVGLSQVVNEYRQGGQGPFTQQTYDFISQDLRNHPLLPGQRVVMMGHSGGGAVVANLAGELERNLGVDVGGIVTLGSPVSNYDLASRYAEQIIQVRHQSDFVGIPVIRTDEGRMFLPREITHRDVGDHPNIIHVAFGNVAFGNIFSGVQEAHGSYMNSLDLLAALNRQFPEMNLDVQSVRR